MKAAVSTIAVALMAQAAAAGGVATAFAGQETAGSVVDACIGTSVGLDARVRCVACAAPVASACN